MTVCFTGHRHVPDEIYPALYDALVGVIDQKIVQGATRFRTGGALGFDTMAAECVLKLKNEYPHIKLILMLPCKDQTIKWSAWEARKYAELLRAADETQYISKEYSRECMLVRDRAMADASSACIAYFNKNSGGTAYTVNYALKKGIPVTNLANAF